MPLPQSSSSWVFQRCLSDRLYFFLAAYLASLALLHFFVWVVLPFFAGPSLHEGLLPGGDWSFYLERSEELAQFLKAKEGESVFRYLLSERFLVLNAVFLLPFGGGAFGFIPFFAALHALSTTVLYSICRLVVLPRQAFLAILPFFCSPTTIFLFTHPLKDSYFLLGFFTLNFSLFSLVYSRPFASARDDGIFIMKHVLLTLASIFLLFLSRQYLIQILVLFAPILFFFIGLRAFSEISMGPSVWGRRLAFRLGFLLFMVIVGVSVARLGKNDDLGIEVAALQRVGPSLVTDSSGQGLGTENGAVETGARKRWVSSEWLPVSIDDRLRLLAEVRSGFLSTAPHAAMARDTDRVISSAIDFLKFTPRALALGFFSPFPTDWSGKGSSPLGSMQRNIAGLEMLLFYFALLGLCYLLLKRKRMFALYVPVLFSLSVLLLFSFIVNNLGTLYRLRYGASSVFLSLGACGLLLWASQLQPRVFGERLRSLFFSRISTRILARRI